MTPAPEPKLDWTDETGRRNRWVRALDKRMAAAKFNSRAISPARFNEFTAAANAALALIENQQ